MNGLREHLQAVYDRQGTLTPALVLAEARPADSPLHDCFTWNDGEAAERWRLHQAHRLIQSVRVIYREGSERQPPRTVRAWHAVTDPESPSPVYEPAEKVARDPLLRAIVLRDMSREWQTLKRRYACFDEFWQLIADDQQEATG